MRIMNKPKTYVSGGPEQDKPNPTGVVVKGKRTPSDVAHERLKVMKESLKEK
jgi:hypothetical protein